MSCEGRGQMLWFVVVLVPRGRHEVRMGRYPTIWFKRAVVVGGDIGDRVRIGRIWQIVAVTVELVLAFDGLRQRINFEFATFRYCSLSVAVPLLINSSAKVKRNCD